MNATTTTTFPYTEDDLRYVLYTHTIDGMNASQYDGKLTPFQTIYQLEGESFHGSVKDEYEAENEQSEYYEPIFIQVLWDLHKPEDQQYFIEHTVKPQIARYQRGKELLQTCSLVQSERSICLSDDHYQQMCKGKKIMSPSMAVSAGYIATCETFRWVALAEKKPPRKEEHHA